MGALSIWVSLLVHVGGSWLTQLGQGSLVAGRCSVHIELEKFLSSPFYGISIKEAARRCATWLSREIREANLANELGPKDW